MDSALRAWYLLPVLWPEVTGQDCSALLSWWMNYLDIFTNHDSMKKLTHRSESKATGDGGRATNIFSKTVNFSIPFYLHTMLSLSFWGLRGSETRERVYYKMYRLNGDLWFTYFHFVRCLTLWMFGNDWCGNSRTVAFQAAAVKLFSGDSPNW